MTDRPTADLTPEERARAIINSGEYLFAIDQIRQAEAAAVEREREACAEIANGWGATHAAREIRSRGDSE